MPYKDINKRREASRISVSKWKKNHPHEANESQRRSDALRREKRKPYKRDMEKARYWLNPELEREQARRRRKEAPDVNREYKLSRLYGLSLGKYQKLLDEQGGICAGCGKSQEKQKRLVVDHCHATGQVRGLLHVNCNVILGMCHESREVLLRLVQYIDQRCQ